MFATPAGWQLETTLDAVVLACSAGQIRVQEELRPIAPVLQLVAAIGVPELELQLATIEHLVTCEGEYGVVAEGGLDEVAIALGFVLLDDTYIRVVGRAADRAHAATVARAVREIVCTTRAFLGQPRRRPFRYEPPAGWRHVASAGGDDIYLAPDYPRHRAAITVPRALPASARDHVSVVKTLLGSAEDGSTPPEAVPIETRRGLRGQRWVRALTAADGARVILEVVALTDGRYDYFARSMHPVDAAGALSTLAESIEPLPSPPALTAGDALAHWAA